MLHRFFFFSVLCLLFFAETAFVFAYLNREQNFPFWDYAMYADMAMRWFSLKGSGDFWSFFQESFSQNYNLLFALPSSLSFSLFGPSRPLFIATNFVFFGLAYQAAAALALRGIFALRWPVAIGLAALLCLLTPFLWYPLLQGYPDHAAATCFLAALGLCVKKETTWPEALLIGVLLGLAIVFRRYFVYPVFALLGASFLFDFYAFLSARSFVIFRRFLSFYSFLGGALAAVLLGLEWSYVRTMFATDFLFLYQSYSRGFVYFVRFLFGHIGLLLLLSVLAGYVFAWQKTGAARRNTAFVFLVFVLWLFLWAAGPSQAGNHYLIAIAPFFCVTGLGGLFLYFKRKAVVCGLAALLSFNGFYALWFSPSLPLPDELPSLSLLSAPRPPWIRKDVSALDELISYLAQTTTDADKIAVVASSFILNQDLLRVVAQNKALPYSFLTRFLFVPEIDVAQPPPFDAFASATVYLVPSPPQFHLGAGGQKGLISFSSFFPPSSVFASLFRKDSRLFFLDRDVTVSVWRRGAWFPAALHEGLALLRKGSGAPFRWIGENPAAGLISAVSNKGEEVKQLTFSSFVRQASLFLDEPLAPGRYRISFDFQSQHPCRSPQFTIRVREASGKEVLSLPSTLFHDPGPFYAAFRLKANGPALFFVSLDIEVDPLAPCSVMLYRLRLEKIPDALLSKKPKNSYF